MGKSDYSIEDLYKDIIKINNYFFEKKLKDGGTVLIVNEPIHDYCHYENNSGSGKCDGYYQMASSGVIHLLKNLKNNHKLEDDKLAEYAILWLNYKLNIFQKTKGTKLNDFYTNYIETNNDYNKEINGNDGLTYKDIINKKKDLMDMDIKEISHFNYPFSLLCYLYSMVYDAYTYCKFYSGFAKDLADSFIIRNKLPNNKEGSSYRKLLSTLSDDYNKLKDIYNRKKSCDFPSIPKIEYQKRPVVDSEQILGHTSEVTSSNSSILSTLIPGLSTFSVIPVFLGIAYKYSLFGVDKLFQRQYLRTKLKKVKKKMKLNI
ncbi:CIR protein PIR protein [Plasmodium vinckei brucechwatti]|uniref:CIR protein PIR protein n=1 Tax=Plasmodium vinckei brucechwatti TaxID=119398 RepID=A0A6V7RYK2_PLAVN|nr:CIR protein PIR protein [Plasmodium vinckei brucechwatti]